MKEKIKNLTLEQISNICGKARTCMEDCPLLNYCIQANLKDINSAMFHSPIIFEEEIEVNLNEEEN